MSAAVSSTAPTVPAPPLDARAREVAERAKKLAQRERFAEILPSAERPTRAELAVMVHELAELVQELVEERSLPR